MGHFFFTIAHFMIFKYNILAFDYSVSEFERVLRLSVILLCLILFDNLKLSDTTKILTL